MITKVTEKIPTNIDFRYILYIILIPYFYFVTLNFSNKIPLKAQDYLACEIISSFLRLYVSNKSFIYRPAAVFKMRLSILKISLRKLDVKFVVRDD